MKRTDNAGDLLTLIGKAINHLQQSIDLFETSECNAGAEHLASVIEEIDVYLEKLDDDPLLKLAALAPRRITAGLHHVRDDLSSVVRELQRSPS